MENSGSRQALFRNWTCVSPFLGRLVAVFGKLQSSPLLRSAVPTSLRPGAEAFGIRIGNARLVGSSRLHAKRAVISSRAMPPMDAIWLALSRMELVAITRRPALIQKLRIRRVADSANGR